MLPFKMPLQLVKRDLRDSNISGFLLKLSIYNMWKEIDVFIKYKYGLDLPKHANNKFPDKFVLLH